MTVKKDDTDDDDDDNNDDDDDDDDNDGANQTAFMELSIIEPFIRRWCCRCGL